MPNWNDVVKEISVLVAQHQAQSSIHQNFAKAAVDTVRRKYLQELHKHTGRNIIAYYSGFLSKPTAVLLEINDEDKNGFMMAVHKLDRTKGFDCASLLYAQHNEHNVL